MMKKIFASLAFSLCIILLSNSAHAYRINVSGWKGGSYNSQKTGRFSHCVVSAKYKRGDKLLLSINRKFVFSLGIADSRWNLRKGAKYDVTLQVDRRQRFKRTAVAVTSRQLVIPINSRAAFFRMMRRGRTLYINANGLNRGYSLRGTRRALNATLRCVKNKMRYASRDENFDEPRSFDQPRPSGQPRANNPVQNDQPVAQPRKVASAPTSRVGRGVSNQKAIIHTINLLSEAGISGYKLLEDNPFKKAGYQVAWRYAKGRRGALATFSNRKKNFVDTQTAKILGNDAKICKGQFASGFRKSDATTAWAGRRLFTVCSNSANGNDFTIHYSIGLQPSGVATIVATHVGSEGLESDTDDSEQIDQAIYKSSVFRKIGK